MRLRFLSILVAAASGLVVVTVTAHASLPGRNGAILFAGYPINGGAVHLYSVKLGTSHAVRDLGEVAPTQNDYVSGGYSADGARVIFVAAPSANVMAMNADGTHKRVLFRSPRISLVTVSPDGQHLAYYTKGDKIVISKLDGSRQRTLAQGVSIQSMSWSSDGLTVYFMGHSSNQPFLCTGGLCAVSVATGTVRTVRHDTNAYYGQITISPDGKKAAFYDHTGPAGIAVVGTGGRNFHKVLKDGSTDAPVWSPDGTKLAYRGAGISVYDLLSHTSRVITRLPESEAVRLFRLAARTTVRRPTLPWARVRQCHLGEFGPPCFEDCSVPNDQLRAVAEGLVARVER